MTLSFIRVSLLFPLTAALFAWDRDKAFQYLEARQQAWAEWKPAQKPGGPCVSCHTGLSYLLASRLAGADTLRPAEKQLNEAVKTRLLTNPHPETLPDPGAEAVLDLVVLALQRKGPAVPSSETERVALKRLWEVQIQSGPQAGSWSWVNAELEPFDAEASAYLGTALADKALSAYPEGAASRTQAMRTYLKLEAPKQSLHNRLAWIAWGSQVDARSKSSVLAQLWAKQSKDGGWTTASLGPWLKNKDAPKQMGSNAYVTAWAAYAVREAGVACSEPRLKRALDWLEKHQDPAAGAWSAVSMNKVYPKDSIQRGFLTDAASGYATAALIGCERP